jgi:predicted transcriptional regulator
MYNIRRRCKGKIKRMETRITVIKIRKPAISDINEELQWFGTSLGLFNLRDRDKSCFRIFIELLKSTKRNKPLSSDELAYRLKLSRGTVMHHVNKLKDAGIVTTEKSRYILRAPSLKSMIGEIEKDMKRMYDDIRDMAEDIDRRLG